MQKRSDWPIRIVAAAAAVMLAAARPADDPLAGLTWLSGDWVSEADGRWSEEQWNAPRGGTMLGIGRSGKGDRATGFEFMRIAAGPDGVAFWGSPGGAPAVPFKLIEQDAASVTFANLRHDFPKRISYRRDGDMLIATVSGDSPADTQSWRYRRRGPKSGSAGTDSKP